MSRSHYKFERFQYRFESKRVAGQFQAIWPGSLGELAPVPADMYEPPVWQVRTGDGRIYVRVENTTIPVL